MTYVITTANVRDGFSTAASDADIAAYIAITDQADACLTAKLVPFAIGRQLKILAVRHIAQNATDGGQVVSQTSVSGASRSFAQRGGGETSYLETLRMLDATGCVMALVSRGGRIQMRVSGRSDL